MRLEGKVALITGSAKGIGAAQARLFAKEGAKVCIADMLESDGRMLESEINASGGNAIFTELDVTSEDNWTRAIDTVVNYFGRLNVLVNNAGIIRIGRIEETSAEDWDKVFDVNAKGVFLGTKASVPAMRKAGGGSVVNISSIAGLIAHVDLAAYSASKGAVRQLTKCTAVEYARDGIRANSVHPGPIDNIMIHPGLANDQREQPDADYLRGIPMGRIGRPEEVAYGALYLASDEASYVTGSELVIDGGFSVFR
jgi:NAD(P)-dependent dehydrogenase (short-subunit alcohol dehydrogenase family)